MNTVKSIIEEIRDKGLDIDGIVQHSYNPMSNDAVNFLVYSGDRITYIVATYRKKDDSRRKLYKQKATMEAILRKVNGTPIKENILFSTWILDLPGGCFRVQKVKKRNFSFHASKGGVRDLKKYLDISTDWIIDFQKVTKYGEESVPSSRIKNEIIRKLANLRVLYSDDPDVSNLLSLLTSRIEYIKTPMMLAMHHGDYCFWNAFIDATNTFRVVDWEFAKESEWVVMDMLSNLIVTWSALRRSGSTTEALDTFFNPKDHAQVMLSEKMEELKSLYGFDDNEMKFYLVYVFIWLFLREERPTARIHWELYLPDMISILRSIDETNH